MNDSEYKDAAVTVVMNPAASSGGAARRWPSIKTALHREFSNLTVTQTTAPGHATALCQAALESGAELIVSVGGDGTNNEVLSGFVDEEGNNRFPDRMLGLVAAGTGGDFQRQFGVLRPEKQVARMSRAAPRTVDYGLATLSAPGGATVTRPFLNTSSAGISGLVSDLVLEANRSLGPTAAYVTASLKGIFRYKNRPVMVRFDEQEARRVDLTLLVVSNGQYFGAGMHACPHASITDGKLAYVLMEGMKKSHVVHALARSFKGKHLRLRNVGHGHASRIELFLPPGSDAEVLLELDGEQPGRAPVSFRAVPNGIRLLVA